MNLWRAVDGAAAGWDRRRSVVTVGNFDGVHLGHRHVLRRARTLAQRLGADSPLPVVAVTFDPHPTQVFAPAAAPLQLTDLADRVGLLRQAGADEVLVLAFDAAVAAWSPREFVERVLVGELHAAGVVVGDDFRFGSRAAGDVAYLRAVGPEHGFEVDAVAVDSGPAESRRPADSPDAERVWSSTHVRHLLADGDVASAVEVLGRLHAVRGTVVEGDKRGREMGYPTANVPAEAHVAVPADGVYAGWLRRLDGPGPAMPAAISVGTNPTFDGLERRVESYVLDRDDLELYGVPVEVTFVARVRGQVRFTGMDDLIVQMGDDVEDIRTLLGRPDGGRDGEPTALSRP